MESVNEVKLALSARSRTATLEELANQGRKQVRLIKAEHVAAMISAAVHTAIEESGFIPKEQAETLVERSRAEFKAILKEREQEMQRLNDLEERLRERDDEMERMQQDLEEARRALEEQEATAQTTAQELEQLRQRGAAASAGQPAAGQGLASPVQPGAAGMLGTPAGMPMTPEQLAAQQMAFQQLAAQQMAFQQLAAQQAGQQPQAGQAGGGEFSAALEKLAGTLNERLEKLGQKMGISSAVEGAEVSFDGLFNDSGPALESNMDNVNLKKKAGGGIAANLARLKKLKGGG